MHKHELNLEVVSLSATDIQFKYMWKKRNQRALLSNNELFYGAKALFSLILQLLLLSCELSTTIVMGF